MRERTLKSGWEHPRQREEKFKGAEAAGYTACGWSRANEMRGGHQDSVCVGEGEGFVQAVQSLAGQSGLWLLLWVTREAE